MRLPRFNAVAGLVIALLLTPIAATEGQAGETLRRVVDFKTLTVGMSGNQPPMNAVSRDGNLMGFDVDLAKALANAMRVRLSIEVMPFAELMEALDEGRVDMVISGLAITPERTEQAFFIGPYMMSGKSILTRKDVVQKFAEGNLNRDDIRLAALKNSTSAMFIQEAAPQAELVAVETTDAAVDLIRNGKVMGMVADMPACALAILRYPDAGLVTLEQPLTVEPIGIAVKGDDIQFLNLVENYLRAYERTGLVTELRKKWLESSAWIAALP
jgi:polar amino acid transport system substrate-binding protein